MRPLVLLLALGCSEGPPFAPTDSLDGGMLDAERPDAEPISPTPILDRGRTDDVRCQPIDVRNFTPMTWRSASVASSSIAPYILLPDSRDATGSLAQIEDRTIGAPLLVRSTRDGRIAARDDGLMLAYARGTHVVLERLDAHGQPVGTTTVAASIDGLMGLARSGPIWGVAGLQDDVLGGGTVWFVTETSTPTAIVTFEDGRFESSVSLAGDDQGFAIAWRDSGGVHFVRLDRDAQMLGQPRLLTSVATASGWGFDRIAVLPLEGGYLVAWSESFWNGIVYSVHLLDRPPMVIDPNGEAWTVIRIARLDQTGAIVEAPLLAAPVKHMDMFEPELLALGDRAALIWAGGEHIYACSGCISTEAEHVLLFDPTTLVPIGEPTSIAAVRGGLLGRSSAFFGNTLYSAARIQYHGTWDPSLATFECN